MTFFLHRAERADVLSDVLAQLLSEPVSDPFAPEVVAVHSRGVERWLSHRLSARLGASRGRADGVCANLQFPFPGRLVQAALAAATGVDAATDPWRPERLAWPLLDVVDASLYEPWMHVLAGHIGAGSAAATTRPESDRDRRFAAVRHLAELYDHYAVHRPSMVLAWADGDDLDGEGASLPSDARWQAELWRRLRRTVQTPSPAERAAQGCTALITEPTLVDLPDRISLFGLTRLPVSYLDVLVALAAHRDVHVLALHPSPAGWGVDDRDQLRHPLLRAWGRDSHEMQVVLHRRLFNLPSTVGASTRTQDLHRPLPLQQPRTLLHHLQAAVRADTPLPTSEERPLLDPGDRSVQIHACHGRARQAEVVRDAITHLLADDPTLEPRDVVIMCPDIDEFAPLLKAAFDDEPESPIRIPYRLADRALRQTNVVLGGVSDLLALVDARLTASQVLAFAGLAPVRQRFLLDDDDLERIAEWVDATGTRWGLDAAHRTPFDLAAVEAGTWTAGLQRLLLGVVMSEDDLRLVDGALPLDDVDSNDIDLAGRFAELIGRLGAAVRNLAEARSVSAWATAIDTAAEQLFATRPADAWQRTQLDQLLHEVQAEAAGHAQSAQLPSRIGPSGWEDPAVAQRERGPSIEEAQSAQLPSRIGPSGWEDPAVAKRERGPSIEEAQSAQLPSRIGPSGWEDPAVAKRERGQSIEEVQSAQLPSRIGPSGWEDPAVAKRERGQSIEEVQSAQLLRLAEIRDLLADRLRGQPSRAAFRTGELTMCTLVPMRSVPHRVVCVVGLDDGAFPRGGAPDGDDLLARTRRLGDHDRRSEDRQLLLDALLAAKDAFVIAYSGRDARTNDELPPAVPVNELIDVIDATVRTNASTSTTTGSEAELARHQVVRHHPLQPSDQRYFVPGALRIDGPWGFDRHMLAGARAAAEGQRPAPPFLSGPLRPLDQAVVALDDLVAALQHPVRAFLRQRLGLLVKADEDRPADALLIELDNLAQWAVGDRLLTQLLAGGDPEIVCAAELARGLLPPGQLGKDALGSARLAAERIAAAARRVADGPRGSLEIDVALADGRRVVGTVPDVIGDTIRAATYSNLGPRPFLRAWVHLLAATASHPARSLRSITVGRRGRQARTFELSVMATVDAIAHLTDLVCLRDEALREPLPLYCATSHAFAEAVLAGDLPDESAATCWKTGYRDHPKEDRDPSHLLVLRGQLSYAEIAADPRFSGLAHRLWDPILAIGRRGQA